ncbi:hypothetical protein YC2023_057787 [Brassica napus]
MAPSVNNGEPAMDTNDWRNHLPFDSRQKIVNKIMATLMKHLPYSGPEGINELKRIAVRFEEKVFSSAVYQTDYLRKISMKMLTMETRSQNVAGSASYIPADRSNLALDELDNLMINNGNVEPFLLNEEPVINSGDWRTQLPPGSRQNIVNKIMDTLKRHFPYSGPEGINELKRIAARFEEKIFSSAVNQVTHTSFFFGSRLHTPLTDYLRKISMKMLTMETKAQNAAGSDSSILADISNVLRVLSKSWFWCAKQLILLVEVIWSKPLMLCEYPTGNHLIKDNAEPSLLNVEPAINSGDWRIQLPLDSRQKNIDKLMETLKKHVPYSGQEGIEELRRIALSFEELIFNTAINQLTLVKQWDDGAVKIS